MAGKLQRSPALSSGALFLGALFFSVALHAVLLPPAADWLERARTGPPSDPAAVPSEIVLPLADWIVMAPKAPAPLAMEPREPERSQDGEDERKRDLAYVRTTANQESLTAPDRPGFISDRNTLATSPEPSSGDDETLPSVAGEDEETREVEDRRFRDGPLLQESPRMETPAEPLGGAPVPAVAAATPPLEAISPSGMPALTEPVVTEPLPDIPDALPLPRPQTSIEEQTLPPEVDEVAADGASASTEDVPEEFEETPEEPEDPASERETPTLPSLAEGAQSAPPTTPAPSTVDLPDRDVEAFQSETRRAKLDGGAKRKGYAAFDAENTPIGRYRKAISAAVERVWQGKMLSNQDFMGFNVRIRVEFTVSRWGKVRNVRVVKRARNAVLTNLTLEAILEAELPEMPPAVFDDLDGGDLPCFFNFRIH